MGEHAAGVGDDGLAAGLTVAGAQDAGEPGVGAQGRGVGLLEARHGPLQGSLEEGVVPERGGELRVGSVGPGRGEVPAGVGLDVGELLAGPAVEVPDALGADAAGRGEAHAAAAEHAQAGALGGAVLEVVEPALAHLHAALLAAGEVEFGLEAGVLPAHPVEEFSGEGLEVGGHLSRAVSPM
ncbi:MAG: hypothetical protein A3J82_05810 [Elusimicrobia bacterium RIFOXYA2_FULL_69_6]|nr:MAG: hypothetical protein A3J82_05810 [Elusimicrobia bacterium RIFOXYA2_FULL_69_6]